MCTPLCMVKGVPGVADFVISVWYNGRKYSDEEGQSLGRYSVAVQRHCGLREESQVVSCDTDLEQSMEKKDLLAV